MSISKRAAGGIYATLALLIVAGAVFFFAVMGMNERNATVDVVRNTESKTDLHDIQIAVEKYAGDHCGVYPGWLIGGEARYAATVDTADPQNTFKDITECERIDLVSDPLLRGGYLTAYPRNPFVAAGGVGIHQIQLNLPSAMNGWDPLANGRDRCPKLGTRFGADCTLMGNVMGDPRFDQWLALDIETGYINPCYTCADADYHHWDMWQCDPPQPHLYGQFFYKSNWRLQQPDMKQRMSGLAGMEPQDPTMYMLGAYGGPGEKGQDVIGPEMMVKLDMGEDGSLSVSPRTSSTYGGMGHGDGSPYGPPAEGTTDQFSFGNPNGIADSVVLVLTGHTGQM